MVIALPLQESTPGAWIADTAMIKCNSIHLFVSFTWHHVVIYLNSGYKPSQFKYYTTKPEYCQLETRPLVKHSSLSK